MTLAYEVEWQGGAESKTLEEIVDMIGTKVRVHERPKHLIESFPAPGGGKLRRFWADLKNVEIKEPGILKGLSGNGETPEEAIRDLARELEGKRVVFDAMGQDRQEYELPGTIEVNL